MSMLDAHGNAAMRATWPLEQGYGLELDATGRLGNLRVDFEALAGFLRNLQTEVAARGLPIERSFIAPEYVPLLLATRPVVSAER